MEVVGATTATTTMNLVTHTPAGALSATHRCSLQFTHPIPPLFSHRRGPNKLKSPFPGPLKPLTLANAESSSSSSGAGGSRQSSSGSTTTSTAPGLSNSDNGSASFGPGDSISFVGQDSVPLEGVIQFEKPESSSFSNKINKWGWVALLAGGDVAALLLFSAIGRFSHGFSAFDPDTLRTADPFVAGGISYKGCHCGSYTTNQLHNSYHGEYCCITYWMEDTLVQHFPNGQAQEE